MDNDLECATAIGPIGGEGYGPSVLKFLVELELSPFPRAARGVRQRGPAELRGVRSPRMDCGACAELREQSPIAGITSG